MKNNLFLIREARARGLRTDQFMAQQDMFGRDLLTDKFTQLLWENNRSPKKLAQGLREMAKFIHNEQSRSKNKDMFGSAISAEDIVSKIEEIIKENYEQEKSAEQERFNLAESSGDKRVDGIDGGGGKQRQQQRGKTQNSKILRKRKIDSNEHKPRQPAGVSVSSVRKRETKKGKAFESRKDNIVENVNVDSIQKAAVAFMKKLPGASKLNVQVVQKASEINAVYKPSPNAEGVYYPKDDSGKVYLIADNLDSIERVHQVLAHEVIGHYGVEAFLGKEFGAILQQIPKIARAPKNADITGKEKPGDAHYATLESVQKLYGDISVEGQAREVLARIAETKAKPTFLATLYAQIKKALRKMGFNVQLSNSDLRQMVVDAGVYLRKQHSEINSSIKDVIANAKKEGHAPQKAHIGAVNNTLEIVAKTHGSDVQGFAHVIDGSAIRHIMNRHFNEKVEITRGQIALTEKDFERIPLVVDSPDYAIFGTRTKLGKNQIGYVKRFSDGTFLYLEELRTGKKQLAGVSLRKYPTTININQLSLSPDPNVQNDGGNKVIVVDLKSKSNRPIESRRAPQTIRPGEQLSAAEAKLRTAALSKIGAFAKKDSIKDRITKIKANFKEKAVQGIFDQFAPLAKLSPTAFMQARLSKGSAGAVEYLLRQQHRDYLSRLKDVLTGAKEKAHAPQKAKIAPVENWFVNKAAEFGLNLSGYSHVIDGSAARHIMNRHTNTSIESSRGQYVVTEKDFEALPAVTSSPDYLIFGSKNRLNKEQIGFIKRMSDNSILYFEEIRTGKKELAAVTLRKYPATKNVEAIASTLDPNVHDDGGNKVIVVDLKSKSNRPIESRRAPQTIRPGEQLSAAEAKLRTAALSKIGAFAKKDSIKDRITKIKANFKEKAVQGIFDQFAPLAKLSPTAFMQARLSKGSAGAVEYLLRGGAVKLTDGALDAVGGKGFEQVLAGLKGEHDLFLAWIAGNRASRLASEWEIVYHNGVTQRYPNEASARQAAKDTVGVTLRPASRENLFTAENIESLKKLNLGKMEDGSRRRDVYDQALKELNALQSSVLDVAQEAGLINKDSRALWESEFYIPFYRVMEEDATGTMGPGQIGGLVGQRAFKKLSGGTEKLGDLAVNVVSNWDHLLGASMKNLAAQNAMQEAVRLGIAQKVGSATKDSVRVMENGKEIHYLVDDPLILDALTALNFVGYKDPFMKVMRTFKHVLTIGVTISPTFRVRNVLRDSLQAISIDSNIKLNPIANIIDSWKRTAKGSMTMDKLLAGGGAIRFGSFTDGQGIGVKRMAAELNVDSSQVITSPSKLLALMRKSYDWYQRTGDRAETINRAAIYEAARAKGKSHLEASFAARDLMDFTAGGKFTAIRILSQILPFFNARLQGIYKLGRGAQENPARFWGGTGVVGLASALLYLSMKDDDDYKALPDWIRNAYWVTKLPGTQTMIYIPKPFEIGALGSIVERGTELAFAGNDYQIKDFSKSIMGIIGDQLAMNPIPQAAKPALEVAFNYDMFREQPIDSVNLQRLPPEERYTSKTSAGAVVLGSALGVSPKKLEHLARGYFGWIGMQALNASDYMIRPFTAMPDNPKRDLTRLDNWFVVGDFLKEANPQSSKYIQRFYDEQKEINQAYAAFNQARAIGDIERAKALIKSGKLDKYKFYNAVAQQMQKISKQIRLIENNSSLSAEEKRERLETLYRTRNQLAMIADERIRQK